MKIKEGSATPTNWGMTYQQATSVWQLKSGSIVREQRGSMYDLSHNSMRFIFYAYRLEFLFSTIIFKAMRNKNTIVGGIDDQNMMYVYLNLDFQQH
jgi:hypothetical protein